MVLFRSLLALTVPQVFAHSALQVQKPLADKIRETRVTPRLFNQLEELARITDITYCVPFPGIEKPFKCLHRCNDFPDFELIKPFTTGLIAGDSAGYIALSHAPSEPRIIIAFRGTQSISNAITDISTRPHDFTGYPEFDISNPLNSPTQILRSTCSKCTVHEGFYLAWQNTRAEIFDTVDTLVKEHPGYQLTLTGHSLGGAVAIFAALEFSARGWNPITTTFGAPRIGNEAMAEYINLMFNLTKPSINSIYRRITHINDPVPLLPPTKYGYRSHAGEIHISKSGLAPTAEDLSLCAGDEDPNCIASGGIAFEFNTDSLLDHMKDVIGDMERFRPWKDAKRWTSELLEHLTAHMDYFSRLGTCLTSGDPFLALRLMTS